MTTRREQILTTWEAALQGLPTTSGRIWRSRVEPLQRHESPGVVIEWDTDTPSSTTSNLTYMDWSLAARAVIVTRDSRPDSVADPIVAQIHQLTIASTALRALLIDLMPGQTRCELLQADSPAALITMDWAFTYRTSYGSQEA